jgi:hypothetical protein
VGSTPRATVRALKVGDAEGVGDEGRVEVGDGLDLGLWNSCRFCTNNLLQFVPDRFLRFRLKRLSKV